MATPDATFEDVHLPALRRYFAIHFATHPDREAMIADAISEAWLALLAKPDAPPSSIAWFAARRVKVGRQFQESTRSLTGPNPRRRCKPIRDAADVAALFRDGANPARIVALRLDFREWFGRLSPRKQRIVNALAMGESTTEVAERFGLSLGRVSQIRGECYENFRCYVA